MTNKNRAWATLTFEGASTEQSIAKQHTLSPTEATTIGRAPNCKIILDPDKFTTVSRRHAEIKFTGAVWKISDLGTTNGTLVNNRPIKDVWQLSSGDRITLGIQGPEFTFECLALNKTVTAQPSKLYTDKIEPEPPVSKSFTRLDLAMPELSADASIIPELKIIPKQDNIESEAEDKPVNPSESVDLELEPVVKSPTDVEPSPAKPRSTEEKQPVEEIGETISHKPTSVETKSPPFSTTVFSYHKTLWNLISITELLTISGHSEAISAIAFSPDGKTLASAANRTIKLWNVAEGIEIANLAGHKLAVNALAFSPDGKTLASAGADKTIKLWNLAQKKEIASFSPHKQAISAIAFSPDGQTLASAGEDKTIKLWNFAKKEETATFTGHELAINALAFSPDGQTLASGSRDKTIKLWNFAKKEETATFTGHQQGIEALVFSPDGRAIASGGADRTIKLWKRATETEIMAIAIPSWQMGVIAFAPDGKTMASSDEQNAVRLWQI